MSQRDHEHMRQALAQRAAQILLESGNRDFHAAKQKAAQQMGATDTNSLPTNSEIEMALGEYQRIFRSSSQPLHLQHLRQIACEAMQFLADFHPRLVGSVLSGTADEHSIVRLHLFADTVESVGFFLYDQHIPYELSERRMRTGHERYDVFSIYRFMVDDSPVELMVFLPKQRSVPLSPVDGKPMKRADLDEVQALMTTAEVAL